MNVGDTVKIVTAKRLQHCRVGGKPPVFETYRLSEEDQRLGLVLKLGGHIKQMTVLTQEGKVKFWFNHQCEVVK